MATDELHELRIRLNRLGRRNPSEAPEVKACLELVGALQTRHLNARRRSDRASNDTPMRAGRDGGQAGLILALLRQRGGSGASFHELLGVSANYRGRISDLRKSGHVIELVGQCYVLLREQAPSEPLPFRGELRAAS